MTNQHTPRSRECCKDCYSDEADCNNSCPCHNPRSQRSREEIENIIREVVKPGEPMDVALLEVVTIQTALLLDNRSLLQEIRDAVVKPPKKIGLMPTVAFKGPEGIVEIVPPEPAKDELFDEVKIWAKGLGIDTMVTAIGIRDAFATHGLSYARAANLYHELKSEGIIQRKDGKGPYRVV